MAIDKTKKIKNVTVDGTEMPLDIPENKLQKLATFTLTELNKEDLMGATQIQQYAFQNQKLLLSIDMPNSITSIGKFAFESANNVKTLKLSQNLKVIGSYAFSSCSAESSLELPNTLTTINDHAFNAFKGNFSIKIPDSVTTMREYAFSYSTFNKIEFGIGIKEIINNACVNCSLLESIIIPEGIKTLRAWCFGNCTKLSSITLPSSINTIENAAFYGCSSLKEMTILAIVPPTLLTTLAISSNTTTIYIPAGTLNAYQTATNWSSFASKFVELSE